MNKSLRLIIAVLTAGLGLALFGLTNDREFINLAPTEGQNSAVILESGHTYVQTFPAARNSSISRVGLFLRPAAAQVARGIITVGVESEGRQVTQDVSTDFIDAQGPTQVRILEPVATIAGAEVTITLRVPKNLSGQIRAQVRELDETFDPALANFAIDEQTQRAPLGYQVYYIQHPPLALQLGGLLLLTALLILVGQGLVRPIPVIALSVVLPLLYILPSLPNPPLLLLIIQIAVFALTMRACKRFSWQPSAVLLGAIIFTFTTWWPLHFASNWHWAPEVLGQGVSLKDIFLDPRQTPSANGGQFEHFGSYVGVIAAVLAFLGLTVAVRDKKLLPYLAVTLLFPFVAVLIPDLIIVTTLGLAFLAAQGLNALHTFLGKDRFIVTLSYIITILVLLDLFNIGARTLEFSAL